MANGLGDQEEASKHEKGKKAWGKVGSFCPLNATCRPGASRLHQVQHA